MLCMKRADEIAKNSSLCNARSVERTAQKCMYPIESCGWENWKIRRIGEHSTQNARNWAKYDNNLCARAVEEHTIESETLKDTAQAHTEKK